MIIPMLLIGLGIILVVLGIFFLYAQRTKMVPIEELEWLGYGEHPFRKKE